MPTENRSSNTDPRDVFIRLNPLGLGEAELRKDSTGFEDQRTHSDYLLFLAGYRETHPEPQPHPEPIAWMVGTAFWWTKGEAERDAATTGLPIVGLGPMSGAAPADELQGEPVAPVINAEQVLGAYQFASFGPANHLRGTTNWCAVFAQELNHRIGADTTEVERIGNELREVREERDDLHRRVDDFQSRSHGIKNLSVIEQLNDKLAERDALLQRMKALFRADDPFDLYDAVCSALSS
ncbi:hypothetical protein KI429_05280 [Pseudomonas shirazica]|nr:hypothetical protein KI429_05280 [Pseudomonas shirazica]